MSNHTLAAGRGVIGICGLFLFLAFASGIKAQSDKRAVLPRTQFPPSEVAAFTRALQIFDPDGTKPAEDARLYGNLRLGMAESDFKQKFPAAKVYVNIPQLLVTAYTQGKGFHYKFWNGHLWAMRGVISLFASDDAGLSMAQKRFHEYQSRAEKLFGDPNKKLSDETSDRDYQTSAWVIWRGDLGENLALTIQCPKRMSELTALGGATTSVGISDDDTTRSLAEAATKMHYKPDPDTLKRLKQY